MLITLIASEPNNGAGGVVSTWSEGGGPRILSPGQNFPQQRFCFGGPRHKKPHRRSQQSQSHNSALGGPVLGCGWRQGSSGAGEAHGEAEK